jgi:RNA polymerase sigma-70 factor, ECF subfamily
MDSDANLRERSFNALYDAHYAVVRAYAWRRSPAFADDIVSETFLVAWKRLEEVPRHASLPWLLKVARNVNLNLTRGERRRREREMAEAIAWPREEAGLEPEYLERSDTRVLQLLRFLTEPDREVLLLVAWEGLDRAAIAKVLGCSRANVALRLHRARRRFQALLENRDSDSIGTPVAGQTGSRHAHNRLFAEGAQHD